MSEVTTIDEAPRRVGRPRGRTVGERTVSVRVPEDLHDGIIRAAGREPVATYLRRVLRRVVSVSQNY